MTCVVRKALAEIGEVEQLPYTKTSQGKIVIDDMYALGAHIKILHARFIMRGDFSPNALKEQYDSHIRTYKTCADEILVNEMHEVNLLIDKFHNAICIAYMKSARTSKFSACTVIHLEPLKTTQDINDMAKTLSIWNQSICDKFTAELAGSPKKVTYHIVQVLTHPTMDDVLHAYEVDIHNAQMAADVEHEMRALVVTCHAIKNYLSHCITQLKS